MLDTFCGSISVRCLQPPRKNEPRTGQKSSGGAETETTGRVERESGGACARRTCELAGAVSRAGCAVHDLTTAKKKGAGELGWFVLGSKKSCFEARFIFAISSCERWQHASEEGSSALHSSRVCDQQSGPFDQRVWLVLPARPVGGGGGETAVSASAAERRQKGKTE